jgi:acyl-CoA thioesterase I
MANTDTNGPLILFEGDSITDSGRNRDVSDDLGQGYAAMAAAWYQALFPERMTRFINRGIGGDTVTDLRGRWQEDCLDLKPDLVSILIGINDSARAFGGDGNSLEEFETNYREILTQVRAIDAEILIMEPFLLPYPDEKRPWRAELDPRIHIVRDLAREFNATYLPLDGIFAQATVRRESAFWGPDGVHPSAPGHALIAQVWLEAAQDLV